MLMQAQLNFIHGMIDAMVGRWPASLPYQIIRVWAFGRVWAFSRQTKHSPVSVRVYVNGQWVSHLKATSAPSDPSVEYWDCEADFDEGQAASNVLWGWYWHAGEIALIPPTYLMDGRLNSRQREVVSFYRNTHAADGLAYGYQGYYPTRYIQPEAAGIPSGLAVELMDMGYLEASPTALLTFRLKI